MKEAIWTCKRVRGAGQYTLVYALRAGRKGAGRILALCETWDNPIARAACELIMICMEEKAQAEGYTIQQEDADEAWA